MPALTLYVTKTRTGSTALLSTSSSTTATATHQSRTGLPGGAGNEWDEVCLGSLPGNLHLTTPPTPDGAGAIWNVTTLYGQRLTAGTWTITLRQRAPTTVHVTVQRVRVYRKNGSTYVLIGYLDLSGTTITTGFATYTFTGTLPAATFASGTKLYVDSYVKGHSTGTVIITSVGGSYAKIVTPGYSGGASASASDNAATADAVARVAALLHTASDAAATVDSAAHAPNFHRTASDSAATVDAIAPVSHISRTVKATVRVTSNVRSSPRTPPRPTITPGTVGDHDYEVIVVNKWGIPYGQIVTAVPTQITWQLDSLGQALIDFWILDPTAKSLLPITTLPGVREVQVWRDQQLIWWGWPVSASYDSRQVHLTCTGLLYPLSKRNFGPTPLSFATNGSFEDAMSATSVPGWSIVQGASGHLSVTPVTGAPVALGNQAVRLTQTNAGEDSYLQQTIPIRFVSGGTRPFPTEPALVAFEASAWVYITPSSPFIGPAGPGTTQRGIYLGIVKSTGEVVAYRFAQLTNGILSGTPPAITGWHRLDTTLVITTVTGGFTGHLDLRLYAPGGAVLWDAVVCVQTIPIAGGGPRDVTTIISIIVTYAQSNRWGKSPLNFTGPIRGGTTGPLTGHKLQRGYQLGTNQGCLDALNEFPSLGICDFEVTWSKTGHYRTLEVFPPAKGSIKWNYPVEIDLGSVTDLQGTVDGTQVGTAQRVLGQGESGAASVVGYAAFPSFLGGRTFGGPTGAWANIGSNVIQALHITTDTTLIGQGAYLLSGALPVGTVITGVGLNSVTVSKNATQTTRTDLLGVGGIILDAVQSSVATQPIRSLQATAETYLQKQGSAQPLPTMKQRADGPTGLFGNVETGDVIPAMFNYGWLTFGPQLMRVVSMTLYPPTEELQVGLNAYGLAESSPQPAPTPPPTPTPPPPPAVGVASFVFGNGFGNYGDAHGLAQPALMASLGANAVAIDPYYVQASQFSTSVPGTTPGGLGTTPQASLRALASACHSAGLAVWLKPMLRWTTGGSQNTTRVWPGATPVTVSTTAGSTTAHGVFTSAMVGRRFVCDPTNASKVFLGNSQLKTYGKVTPTGNLTGAHDATCWCYVKSVSTATGGHFTKATLSVAATLTQTGGTAYSLDDTAAQAWFYDVATAPTRASWLGVVTWLATQTIAGGGTLAGINLITEQTALTVFWEAEWRHVCSYLKAKFPGLKLMYGALAGAHSSNLLFDFSHWQDACDYLGVDFYQTVGSATGGTSIATIEGNWTALVTKLTAASRAWGTKQVMFGEIGYRSIVGCENAGVDKETKNPPSLSASVTLSGTGYHTFTTTATTLNVIVTTTGGTRTYVAGTDYTVTGDQVKRLGGGAIATGQSVKVSWNRYATADQANCVSAFLATCWGKAWFAGFHYWVWAPEGAGKLAGTALRSPLLPTGTKKPAATRFIAVLG